MSLLLRTSVSLVPLLTKLPIWLSSLPLTTSSMSFPFPMPLPSLPFRMGLSLSESLRLSFKLPFRLWSLPVTPPMPVTSLPRIPLPLPSAMLPVMPSTSLPKMPCLGWSTSTPVRRRRPPPVSPPTVSVTGLVRPVTGLVRPSTASRPGTRAGAATAVEARKRETRALYCILMDVRGGKLYTEK
ncbi:hypothetical protein GGS20DRAFT_536607 [Poronia punctata]|nr:hypothetical protein GGS20DRAFT_536607 [Poronia punctata]